jgi:hypothetical protein
VSPGGHRTKAIVAINLALADAPIQLDPFDRSPRRETFPLTIVVATRMAAIAERIPSCVMAGPKWFVPSCIHELCQRIGVVPGVPSQRDVLGQEAAEARHMKRPPTGAAYFYSGGRSPGDCSHSLMWDPVSACRALRIISSRLAPGGCNLASARRRFASSASRSSSDWVWLKRRRAMTQPRRDVAGPNRRV